MKFTTASVLAALAVAGTVQANTVTKPTTPYTPVEAPKYEGGYVPPSTEYALEQLNKIRASKGLKPVCVNKSLQASAQAHADWMARTGQHKHAPDTFQRMERYGYPGNTLRAENIAVNQNGVSEYGCFGYGPKVADVNTSAAYTTNCAWYQSKEGHKENMLGDFNQVGIAYAKGQWAGRESYFWVQNFGKSSQPCVGKGDYAAPAPAPKPAPYKPAPAPVKKPEPAPYKPAPAKEPETPAYKGESPIKKPAVEPVYGKKPAPKPAPVKEPETPAYKDESPVKKPAPTKESEYEVKPVTPAKKCKKWIKDAKKPAPTDVYGDDEAQKAKPTTPAGGDYSYGSDETKKDTKKPVPTDVYGGEDQKDVKKPTPTDVYGGADEDKKTVKPTTPAGGDYSYGAPETPETPAKTKPVPTDVYGGEDKADKVKPVPTTPAGGDYSYGAEEETKEETKKPVPTDVYGGEDQKDVKKPTPTDVYGGDEPYGKDAVKPVPTDVYGGAEETKKETKKPKKCKPKKAVKPVPTDVYGGADEDKKAAKPTTPAADYSYGAAPAPAPVPTEPVYGKKPAPKKEEKKTVEEPKQETVYNGDSFY